ncbi:hypothetical protein [Streptomyces sp. CB02959]|uniref:hypothetical protein n=1 Tax=Streptomyces sp. CB02959 TaxID=2020330 RepID=UPI00215363EC|nr:hypothetical protein [Streptomyces sp. CB02959]
MDRPTSVTNAIGLAASNSGFSSAVVTRRNRSACYVGMATRFSFSSSTSLDDYSGATAPRQYACQPGCGNTVRTDAHALQLRTITNQKAEIEELRQLVTKLTLASAVLVDRIATECKPAAVRDSVLPFPRPTR